MVGGFYCGVLGVLGLCIEFLFDEWGCGSEFVYGDFGFVGWWLAGWGGGDFFVGVGDGSFENYFYVCFGGLEGKMCGWSVWGWIGGLGCVGSV